MGNSMLGQKALSPDTIKGIQGTEWHKEYTQEHGEPPNLNTPHFDYAGAWAAGERPNVRNPHDGKLHWGSTYKADTHPNKWKNTFMEQYGIDPDSINMTEEKFKLGEMVGHGLRHQPEQGYKRDGYLGQIPSVDGNQMMTEYSIQDSNGVDVPSMVPTLTAEEIQQIRMEQITPEIQQKALAHAIMRREAGQSAYSEGEYPSDPYPSK